VNGSRLFRDEGVAPTYNFSRELSLNIGVPLIQKQWSKKNGNRSCRFYFVSSFSTMLI
jgi:hypothetical protein